MLENAGWMLCTSGCVEKKATALKQRQQKQVSTPQKEVLYICKNKAYKISVHTHTYIDTPSLEKTIKKKQE